jgi:hypothetical protein
MPSFLMMAPERKKTGVSPGSKDNKGQVTYLKVHKLNYTVYYNLISFMEKQ